MTAPTSAKTNERLAEVIRRIADAAQPERIILFGSSARGEGGPNSDLDLLVIKGGEYDYHLLMESIYTHLHGVEMAVDVVLVTPEQVDQYRDTHCLVIKPALREGKEVYRA